MKMKTKMKKLNTHNKTKKGGKPKKDDNVNVDEKIKSTLSQLRCSPRTKKTKRDYTCLSDEALMKLKNLWNARHPDAKIKTTDSKEIWKTLNAKLKDVCNKESCWLKQKFTQGKLDKELSDSFAPKSPEEWKKNPNEWLSSTDILKVMKQYEKTYKCFDFMGPSPIDYDTIEMYGECVWEELCKFNLSDQIKSGKTKIGVIFNTDKHDKPGEHWVSLFINIKKGKIFYFDSAGDKAKPEITKLVKTITEQGKKLSPPINFVFDQNHPVQHQYGGTECGIYSLYFIVHMLEDKINSYYLKNHILKDKYMEKFRKVYFNEEL